MPNNHSLPHNVRADEIMQRKLITLPPELDVFNGIEMLVRHQISGAPVVDGSGRLLGVFSEESCMKVLLAAAYEQLPTNRVDVFMDTGPTTITEDADLLSIAQIFSSTSTRRLPVVREEKLVGQISRRDVMKAALNLISKHPNFAVNVLYLSATRSLDETPFP
jgi:CBS domain-containing protein